MKSICKTYLGMSKLQWRNILICTSSAICCEILSFVFNLISSTPDKNVLLISLSSIARISTLGLLLYCIHTFSGLAFRRFQQSLKDLLVLHSVLLLSLLVFSLLKIVAIVVPFYFNSRTASIFSQTSADSWMFFIPFAFGSLLIQAVSGMQASLVYMLSLLAALIIYPIGAVFFLPYCLLCCIIGSISFATVRSRSAYLRSGLTISLFALFIAILSFAFLKSPHFNDIYIRLIGAFCSGILAGILATGITPILEHLSGFVTDMRLIEISTLDHPLLKKLSIQAPGTWNHSMVVGMMVEAAASDVKANPVLARVGAYFHDIGKMDKPLYFIENKRDGVSKHDKLSPSMSALIIKSHVKEGIDMAEEYKIPKPVIDMIAQHHGTSMIEFFYDKAIREAEEKGNAREIVDVAPFTYSGPKPQTKEAAILMLADCIESSSRTISDPSADRLQGHVQKLINKIFASGELEESDLTLKDLHIIAKTFSRVLSGIFHQRISYENHSADIDHTSNSKDLVNSQDAKENDKSTEDKRNSETNLKRLGLD